MIDMSMERIRGVIDRAYRENKSYACIDRTGDPQVDREICRMVDSWGMRTAENDTMILISWAGGAEAC